ncbi:hypothetical protein Pst134EB_026091 [Puccinia striiformis f. sp. tritici]|uniref:Uncharacterized protein n=1 Tax=Puccinia striiformis f. sp. tritici PST-78 TaxID=1165861 RepID=A0A0L0W0U1_9BASI|nr:hypothetical protein Pst134EB_026091 [Puccinia striiformis f. sp. tritici]KNF05136.1 hypothetical protein PSTG_01765 [Puccinia striiformis f. sp. tritici PST-78]
MGNIALYQLIWTASQLIRPIILYQGSEFRQEFGSLESFSQGVGKPADTFHPQGGSSRRPKLEADEESSTKRQRIHLQGQQPIGMLDNTLGSNPEANLESVRCVTNHPGTSHDQPREDTISFYPLDQSVPLASTLETPACQPALERETLTHQNDSHRSCPSESIQAQFIENSPAALPQPPFVVSRPKSSSDPMLISKPLGWVPSTFPIVRGFNLPKNDEDSDRLTAELASSWECIAQREKDLGDPIVDQEFDYLPVDMVSYPGHSAKVIRVLNRNYHHASMYVKSERIEHLFRLMVCNHRLSSSQIERATPHQRFEEQRMILRWFKNQLHDAEHSLPVLGEVKSFQLGKGFGPVQRWIIWYLHHGDFRSFAYTTSVALIWLWYKAQALSKWEKLEINRQNLGLDSFWSLMHHYANARKTGPDPKYFKFKAFHPSFNLPSYLGENMNLKAFRTSTQQYNNWFFKFTADPGEIETHKVILDKLYEVYKPYRTVEDKSSAGLTLKNFYGTFSSLEPVKHSETNEDVFAIRPTDSTGKVIQFGELSKRLENLLESCRWWYENLKLGLKAQGIEPIDDANQKFFDWLQEIMYGTKHSLPVFGIINQETYNLFDGQPGFTSIQRFVIHHFSSNSSPESSGPQKIIMPSSCATDSITLIVYWIYSNRLESWQFIYHPKRYIQYFIDGFKINQQSLAR